MKFVILTIISLIAICYSVESEEGTPQPDNLWAMDSCFYEIYVKDSSNIDEYTIMDTCKKALNE